MIGTLVMLASVLQGQPTNSDAINAGGLTGVRWHESRRMLQETFSTLIAYPSRSGEANDLIPGKAARTLIERCTYDIKFSGINDRLSEIEMHSVPGSQTVECFNSLRRRLESNISLRNISLSKGPAPDDIDLVGKTTDGHVRLTYYLAPIDAVVLQITANDDVIVTAP